MKNKYAYFIQTATAALKLLVCNFMIIDLTSTGPICYTKDILTLM